MPRPIRRAASEDRNRLKAIVDCLCDAIIGESLDGTITSWNRSAETTYGYAAREAIGKNISMIVPPERAEELNTIMATLRAGERIQDLETVRVRKDGTHVEMLLSICPVVDDRDRVVGAASIARDITGRAASKREREHLEEELHQAQRLESVGQLAGGIAHDFNNLLAVIINYATFVRDELPAGSELKSDVEEIARAAERGAALTRQLLVYSRRDVVQPEVLDLEAVVGDMKKPLRRSIGARIELSTTFAPDLWRLWADRGQLEQVVLNLFLNAGDAMPVGGRLTIEATNVVLSDADVASIPDLWPGRYVQVTISDTGVGMTKEVLSHAFEPFFTTKPRGQGTGLGLATVYGILRQAGGHVSLESEVAHGTALKIYFPAAETSAVARPAEREHGAPSGRGEVVLVVEDDASVRAVVRRILSKHGYAVLEAPTPSAAVAIAESHQRIHLLLSDVMIPEMSGRELARALRGIMPSVRVLYMSGYPADVLGHQGVLETGVSLLEKPFSEQRLLAEVRRVLDSGDTP